MQVAAGAQHTILVRSDGIAVACGNNHGRHCRFPALVRGLTYAQVAAGYGHAVLLRSDGIAVARGSNIADGQCDRPALVGDLTCSAHLFPSLPLHAALDGDSMRFLTFSGAECFSTRARAAARLADMYDWLMARRRADRLGPKIGRVDAVLPGGRLLSGASAEEAVACAFEPGPPG